MSEEKSALIEVVLCKNRKGVKLLYDLYIRLYFQDEKLTHAPIDQGVNRSDLFLVRCIKSLIKTHPYRDSLIIMQVGNEYDGKWSIGTHRYSLDNEQEEIFEELLIDGKSSNPTHRVSVFKTHSNIFDRIPKPPAAAPPVYEDE